jgi:hypothetical protein
MIYHPRRFLLPVIAVAIGCTAVGCNSSTIRQAEQIAGEEAALAALQSALTRAGITSADHMTDAVVAQGLGLGTPERRMEVS